MSEEELRGHPSIFDFNYQKNRAEFGKKARVKSLTCCQSISIFIFRHLIHLFACTFVIAFALMIYIVKEDETDNMGLNSIEVDHVKMLDEFISHHPTYYGLANTAG